MRLSAVFQEKCKNVTDPIMMRRYLQCPALMSTRSQSCLELYDLLLHDIIADPAVTDTIRQVVNVLSAVSLAA